MKVISNYSWNLNQKFCSETLLLKDKNLNTTLIIDSNSYVITSKENFSIDEILKIHVIFKFNFSKII